jgi:hypothetical protein
MFTFALRIGNHDFGFPGRSLNRRLHFRSVVALDVCAFTILESRFLMSTSDR